MEVEAFILLLILKHFVCFEEFAMGGCKMSLQTVAARKMSIANLAGKPAAALMDFPDVSTEVVAERKDTFTLRATPALKTYKGCM